MTFVSHAQNCEDVMLWRALKDVGEGFWIDVGAADPREYSVTLAFSERGWRGINVEPEPAYAAALRAARPRDVNLEVAVGAAPGRARLQHLPGTGLSTFDPTIADRHGRAGFERADALDVEVRTLASICAEHAPADIHFLKIDVEGSEGAVLQGADFARFRPWIVVVEATAPSSPVRATEGFERHLFAADYRECWFDGLNTFYLAAERADALAPAFQAPPNVFDFFIRADHAAALTRIAELEAELAGARAAELDRRDDAARTAHAATLLRAGVLEAELGAAQAVLGDREAEMAARQAELGAEVARLNAVLAGMHASASWRITAPLRAIKRKLRGS